MGTPQAVITIESADLDNVPVSEALDAVRALCEPGADVQLSYDEADDDLVIKVKIENTYSDGHSSERIVLVEEPLSSEEADIEDWWENTVREETGDEHGKDASLGFCYTATVLAADDHPWLVDRSREWAGS